MSSSEGAGCGRVWTSRREMSQGEISQVTAKTASVFAVIGLERPAKNRGFPRFLVQGLAVFLLHRTAATARSALRVERGGGDGSGRGVRLRRGAVPTDGGALDRARLPLPRLPEDDRQCIRAQHVDREELRRGRSQHAEIIH